MLLVIVASGGLSCLLTYAVWRVALARGLLDLPNERSSHTRATPRGGGLSIVLVVSVGVIALAVTGLMRTSLALALLGGGTLVAAIGFLDDRGPVRPGVRLAVHFLAALCAVVCIGPLSNLQVGGHLLQFAWAGYIVSLLIIVWTLNLFNFMDGIDGIAGSEALFIAVGAILIEYLIGGSADVSAAAGLLAAGCAGFLVWNWPPARIFMGDVGSGYLGYVLAVLAIAAAGDNPAAAWPWLILGGLFFIDASVTLVRRLARGERVQDAHRSHAYQWLARRWRSHGKVTALGIGVNVLFLLPCAVAAALHPHQAIWIGLGALTPLVALARVAGAGRKE